jgi:hypothetical protein
MTNTQRKAADLGERKILADIAEHGWHDMNVVEDDGHPPWSFTIGFYDTWRYPELIIIGRSRATAHQMLSTIADELDANRHPDLTDPTPYILLGIPCRFVEVAAHHYSDYVGFARWYYRGKHFPLYQIVWPSTDGHYPWHPQASEHFKAWQPVLGKPAPD